MPTLDLKWIQQAYRGIQGALFPSLKRGASTHLDRRISEMRTLESKKFWHAYLGMGARSGRSSAMVSEKERTNKCCIDWNRFSQAYGAAQEIYLRIEGVLGVGYGRCQKKKADLGIIVLVNKKFLPSRILQKYPSRILKKYPLVGFEDVPIEVREPQTDGRDAHGNNHAKGSSTYELDLRNIDWGKVNDMHLKMLRRKSRGNLPQASTLSASTKAELPSAAQLQTAVEGQVFVIENPLDEDYTLITDIPGKDQVNWARAYQYFQLFWADNYDFVAMVLDHASGMPGDIPSFGRGIFNEVEGINFYKGTPYNGRKGYYPDDPGDPDLVKKRLRALQVQWSNMPSAAITTDRYARLMEIAHSWCAYVFFKDNNDPEEPEKTNLHINNPDFPDAIDEMHWGKMFDSYPSSLGVGGERWHDNGDGTFSLKGINPNDFQYCRLDLYLMGMISRDEVGPFYYFDGLERATDSTYKNTTRKKLLIETIENAHGPRLPDATNSPRSFRQAWIVLTNNLASGRKLAKRIDEDRKNHTVEFRSSTGSRGMLDTYLYKDSYDSLYLKHNAQDTGAEPSTGIFLDSPDIWVRNVDGWNGPDGNQPESVGISQNAIRHQDNYVYVRIRNSGDQPSGDITVNLFQADRVGTDFLYPQDWKWDANHLIGSTAYADVEGTPLPPSVIAPTSSPIPLVLSVPARNPATNHDGEVVILFKWEKNKIELAAAWQAEGRQTSLLAEILPIHRTQTKLRRVWEDPRIAEKNITIIVNPPA